MFKQNQELPWRDECISREGIGLGGGLKPLATRRAANDASVRHGTFKIFFALFVNATPHHTFYTFLLCLLFIGSIRR